MATTLFSCTKQIPLNEIETLTESMQEKLSTGSVQGRIFFPWVDVITSMTKDPEKVYYTDLLCLGCLHPAIKLYFSSPDWTWRKLCGRAGTMIICPHCMKQIDFRLEIMN